MFKRRLGWMVLALILCATLLGRAQQQSATEGKDAAANLDTILEKARAQLANYTQLLPNILATEHGESELFHGDRMKRRVTFTADLTMVHAPLPNLPQRVTEALRFRTENQRPVKKTPTNIPMYLVNVFSNQDPSILPPASLCIQYSILPSTAQQIVIERRIDPVDAAAAAVCAKAEVGEKLMVTLDARSFQMIAVDRPVQPRKDLSPGFQIGFQYQYGQRQIGDKSYLLPTHLQSTLIRPDKGIRKTFHATYSDYRRYGSTATIRMPVTP